MKGVQATIGLCLLIPAFTYSQSITSTDSTLSSATLENCIRYGLEHQPVIKTAEVDAEITEATIRSKLADWYPQLNLTANLQHFFKPTVNVFPVDFANPTGPKREVPSPIRDISTPALTLTQNIFNRDVLLASRTAKDVRLSASQNITANKIEITAAIARAFYDVLLTQQQIQVLDQTIARLDKSLKDAFNQYQAGVADKIDYKRATIALNNSKADRRAAQVTLQARYEFLKQQMGYPITQSLQLQHDTASMENQIGLDTLQGIRFENRIEFQQLQTQQRLLQSNLKYNQWSFIPTLSAFGNYNLVYQSGTFSELYDRSYPNSAIGLQLAFPLFQGGKRHWNIRQAELQIKRTDYELADLKNGINSEYSQALATYKSNLNDYLAQKENLALATDVYNTLQLQYRAGVKTYLEVIIAETELRTTQLNFYNALYQVLSSKVDVQKALGIWTW